MFADQGSWDIRCEWGPRGLAALAPTSDVVILVDVMSFSTCVSVGTSRGAEIYPWRCRDASAADFARSIGAELAGTRKAGGYSLSPTSLSSLPAGARLVLPSPNGATLSLAAGQVPLLAGCLRNARTVAEAAMRIGRRIAVIPAGERWREDGSLRPAFEDLVGAGAIIQHVKGGRSPEARSALAAFQGVRSDLKATLAACASGLELTEMGYAHDLAWMADLDADEVAPRFSEGAYRA
ncbi:MAG TPA: 2-phosphosulfolactate phosphatase [Holophaga sp.]|nr:2-phosphosulfolactate phosphatase [Holophaga sp.]